MEVEKNKDMIRIDYTVDGMTDCLYVENGKDSIYIEGIDGGLIPAKALYTLLDWVEENIPRPKKKYKVSFVLDAVDCCQLPPNSTIEEFYA